MPKRRTPTGGAGTPTVESGSDPHIKDHILDRTIFLVGKKGTTDITVREIALEAGVNVAAVNYYFSSKEQMFEQMAARFLAGFDDVMQLLETRDAPPTERLRRWAREVMRHLAEYPGFLPVMERHMTVEPLDPFGRALRTAMKRAVRQLTSALRECVGQADESRITFKLTLLISALAGPFPRLIGKAQNRPGPRGESARARFLDLLLEHIAG
jgi:AcrR family transcriptional regulator